MEKDPKFEWTCYVFQDLMGELPKNMKMAEETAQMISEQTVVNMVLNFKGTDVVGHETAHVLFSSLVDGDIYKQKMKKIRKKRKPSRRSRFPGNNNSVIDPKLVHCVSDCPDWLEEAVATYHENKKMKLIRRKGLKTENIISLKKFFEMENPAFKDISKNINIPLARAKRKKSKKRNIHMKIEITPENKEADCFYSQSLAMTEYITERYGKPFFRYVAFHINNGAGMLAILKSWNKLVPKFERNSKYRVFSKKTRHNPENNEKLPEALKINNVLFFPGEQVKKVPKSFEEFETDFKKWAKEEFPKNTPKLPPYPM